jgi:TRAP-type C4-dicarboxylate transport system permease small subunit
MGSAKPRGSDPGARAQPAALRHPAYRALTFIGVVVVVVMLAATLTAVVARYFEITGFEWSYEVAGIAFLWTTFLGALAAEMRGDNAAFDVLHQAAGARLRAVLDGMNALLLLAVGAVILASGIAMLRQSGWTPTPLLRWPGLVTQAALPLLGGGLVILAGGRLVARGRRRAGDRAAR